MKYFRSHVLVCIDPECLAKGAHEVIDALQDELVAQGLIDEVQVLETSRIGDCSQRAGDDGLSRRRALRRPDRRRYPVPGGRAFPEGARGREIPGSRRSGRRRRTWRPKPKEVRVVLRNCGKIDPDNIEDYIAEDGYQALAKVLTEMTPRAGDRRSAAIGPARARRRGFPGGKKWQICARRARYAQIPDLQRRRRRPRRVYEPPRAGRRSALGDRRHDHRRLRHRRQHGLHLLPRRISAGGARR